MTQAFPALPVPPPAEATGPGETAARRWILAAAFAALVLLAVNIATHYSVADDAYISFRYLDRWLAGQGLTYNPGERVEGYTNFLWIVLLAPLRVAGLRPEAAAFGLSLVAVGVLLWAVYRTAESLGGGAAVGWTAVVLAAGSVPLARWATSGMETVGFAALLALGNQQLAARRTFSREAGISFGFAVLARPSGALHAAVAFIAALPWRGPARVAGARRLIIPALVGLALPLGHLFFRLEYYGLPLPNTYYAKLTGDMPNLVPAGFDYLLRFGRSGSGVLLICGAGCLLARRRWNWVVAALAAQALLHTVYVVRIGGDYFPFARFLVPVIPALAVLGALGLADAAHRFDPRVGRFTPLVALPLTLAQSWAGYASRDEPAFAVAREIRVERELVAEWLARRLEPEATLAVNAAGVIPYRTRVRTIDMLGLNDRHIAHAAVGTRTGAPVFVGHFKHDGGYVCDRAPDAVVTSGGALHPGRTAEEAIMQAALNTFPGDREFLQAPGCRGRYLAVAEELAPGKFAVAYFRRAETAATLLEPARPATAQEWFARGLTLMQDARLEAAVLAFEQSLALNPGNPAALTNLGYCQLDLQRYEEAVAIFDRVGRTYPQHYDALYGLALAHEKLGHRERAVTLWREYMALAPESPWKAQARQHLQLLTGADPDAR